MRPHPRRWLTFGAAAALLLTAGLLTACESSPPASPSASPEASADGSGGPFPSPFPSFVGNEDLEATLPDEAAGIIFFKVSMSGPDFMNEDVDEQFLRFLDGLGADIEDVSVAFAIGTNADGTQTASVFAFQVAGAQADELTDEFKAAAEEGGDPLVWHAERLGGKLVEVSDPNADFPTPVVLYATGDVLYFVSSTDPNAVEAVVAFLP